MFFLILAIALFVVQNLTLKEFSRRFPNSLAETARMNMFALPLGALCLIPAGGLQMLSPVGFLLALAFGVSYVLVSSLYLSALACGPFSLSAMMSSMGVIVTVGTNLLLWHEPLSTVHIIGFACLLVVIVLTSLGNKGGSKASFKWFLLALGALITNGTCGVAQKAYNMLDVAANASAYSFWSFLFAAAIYAVMAFTLKPAPILPEKRKSYGVCVVGIGIGSVAANMFVLMSLSYIPSVVAYPVMQGALVALLALCSLLIYREKFTLRTALSVGISIIGIVLLNL